MHRTRLIRVLFIALCNMLSPKGQSPCLCTIASTLLEVPSTFAQHHDNGMEETLLFAVVAFVSPVFFQLSARSVGTLRAAIAP